MNYDIIFFIFGIAFLASAWLPPRLHRKPLSLPMVWLAVGVAISLFDPDLPEVNPIKNSNLTEHLTELALIISLLSGGLKLDRAMGWRSWNDTWRLLGITMPLCIGMMLLSSWYILQIPLAVALLLGAITAPTDPVLASDVQVGPPSKGEEHDVRFALTSEAGLNDGLSFPFVLLAITLANLELDSSHIIHWFTVNVLWEISAGVIAGAAIGYLTAMMVLRPSREHAMNDGFIAIALTFLAYGGTQLIHGYGFIGVFVAAHVFRHYQHDHQFHNTLYNFSEQLERLIVPLLLILMGLFIYQGIFIHLTWKEITVALFFLIVIRPLCGLIGLMGSKTTAYHRIIIAVFGIRGIGSFYYLAYALNHCHYFESFGQQLWRISVLIVLISIVFHGMSASMVFHRLSSARSLKNRK